MNNPLTYLDAILADWTTPRVRRLIHALILVAAFGATFYLAGEGDWKKALLTLLAGAYAGSNHANTNEPDPDN